MKKALKYLNLYRKFFIYHLNAIMAYKVNFVVQSLYAPAYVVVMFFMVKIAYTITPVVAGWSEAEGYLLFLVFHLIFTCCFVLFMKGAREFVYFDIRQGKLDFYLTKPVDSQFMSFYSKPEVEQFVLMISLALLLFYQMFTLKAVITPAGLLMFLVAFVLGIVVCYGIVSLYSSMAFYLTRASQVFEVFMKISDFGQYPQPLFPFSFQLVAVTLIPMAFFGYIPTLFLLGRGSWWLLLLSAVAAVGSVTLSKIVWQHSLKQYSSASS